MEESARDYIKAMSANSFGQLFRIHSFGESHGTALGVVIDGCPSGIPFDLQFLQSELDRRKPGGKNVSARQESDQVEVLSGVFEGRTLGTPIAMMVRNQDSRSQDYAEIAKKARSGHADDVWREKFAHVDPRGGGRSSGRETVARVMAGAVAKMFLREACPDILIRGFACNLGPIELSGEERREFLLSTKSADEFVARFPSMSRSSELERGLQALKENGNSWGGVCEIVIQKPPRSLGQPVFHKLKSDLAAALMSVGAASAVELGEGLHDRDRDGLSFHHNGDSSAYGGIRGGISTGETISLKVHVKPTSSILDVAKKGRHDPCVLIRAIPVFESMVALTLADHLLWCRLDR